jgi:hypothetical protein
LCCSRPARKKGLQPMTEAEWLTSADPMPMLDFLRGKASELKLRLFACACCRRVLHLMPDGRSRRALDTAELVAEGLADEVERKRVSETLLGVGHNHVGWALMPDPFVAAARGAFYTAGAVQSATRAGRRQEARRGEELAQVEVLRDIFEHPFRAVAVTPVWLTSDVLLLARTMFDSRDYSAMPILADALQDAGCDNEDVLNHCRGDGPHVRGCWVVDLVLGKE